MSEQSLVAQWNEVMLEAIRSGSAFPTETTYQLYLASSAIYDAWAAYDTAAFGQYAQIARPDTEHSEANKAAAVSHAAYAMLSEFFPGSQQVFDDFMDELGYDKDDTSTDPSSAAGVGNLAAQTVLAAREGDGSNAENGYADTTGYTPVNSADPDAPNAPGGPDFDPNEWQPLRVPNGTLLDVDGIPVADNADPTTYDDQVALTPHWGGVTAFALESGDQFRPPEPPKRGDLRPYTDGTGVETTHHQAYIDQVNEVMEASANLTTREKVIAELWADGPRTESPPGHWNQIAQDIALREGHGIDEDAKLFFALNAAVFDAGIATWEAKYAYSYVRPQSAIRDLYYDETIEAWGGPNKGTEEILGQEWQPYQKVTFVTPPFPEFVSGHSTFSMAAAKTIAAFVGSDVFYDGSSQSNYDLDHVEGTDLLGQFVATELSFEEFPDEAPVILQWETLTEAAEEAGISRIYGGIHIQDGNLRGLEVGEQVAELAALRWEALFTLGGDDLIEAGPIGAPVMAGPGADTVMGSMGRDVLMGDEGDDLVRGRARGDEIDGGDGDDRLHGGRGQDTIESGAGVDTLIGGRGSDVFVLQTDARNTIRDFTEEDVLVIEGAEDPGSLGIVSAGSHLIVSVDGGEVALLRFTDATDLALAHNLLLVDEAIF